jgi:hypothetical protein
MPENPDQQTKFKCWCPVRGEVIPVRNIQENPPKRIVSASRTTTPTADGIAFVPTPAVADMMGQVRDIWMILRGDFVIDINGKAIDAEFVRAQLPTGDRPTGSPFGIQGGLFESWVRIAVSPISGSEIHLNTASVDELTTVPGITDAIARQIITRRRTKPFTDPSELLEIRGVGPATLDNIKSLIKFD